MSGRKRAKIVLILLAGLLSCLMVSMLHMGGGIHLKCFLGAEKVYDVPENDLVKEAKGWEYHGDVNGYCIVENDAVNKYRIGQKTGKWKYLYITINQMNVPSMNATLEYYNKEKELLAEQPILLTMDENVIPMYEDVAVYRIGIRLRDAEGTFFSIQSMQTRSEISGYTPKRFAKAMVVSCGAFLVLFCIGLFLYEKKGSKWQLHTKNGMFLKVLQKIYMIPGNFLGAHIGRYIKEKQRDGCLTGGFCIMFLWVISANALELTTGDYYRYFVLGCVVLLVLLTIFMWEKTLTVIHWNNPLALSWCGLWIMMIISDIFVDAGNKFMGYVMLFAGGFMIFSWNQMKNPQRVLRAMMEALEIDFGFLLFVGILLRRKTLPSYYNRVFGTSEMLAMYALLMLEIFLLELFVLLRKRGKWKLGAVYAIGAVVSFYLTVESYLALSNEWSISKVMAAQRGYARMLGLVGNISRIYVSRDPVSAYNGYLEVMYRYGIYAVIPFLMYQYYSMYAAVKNGKRQTKAWQKEQCWIILVNMTYILCCIVGISGMTMAHPLTWCFFLVNGYYFLKKT